MSKPGKPISICAAECARRTGLTVRALRLYERHGLIEPARSGKGWRLYGQKELNRLNVVVTLKAFGMTLAQIRALMKSQPPPLRSVLDMQLRACRVKKYTAEKALALVEAAHTRIKAGGSLDLDELCNLTRSMNMGSHQAIARELINAEVTPDEERAYATWIAARPPGEIKAMQEYGAAMHDLFLSLRSLREKGIRPAAREAQVLISDWNALAVRYGIRQFIAAMIEWDSEVAQKLLRVGERALSRSMASHQTAPDDGLWDFFSAAQEASSWHQALAKTADEATKLVRSKTSPSSAKAAMLARRLKAICLEHSVGDPSIYSRWAGAMQFRKSAGENARLKAAWVYLAHALEALPRDAH